MAQSYSSIQWWQATLKAPNTSNDKARNQSDGKKKKKEKPWTKTTKNPEKQTRRKNLKV